MRRSHPRTDSDSWLCVMRLALGLSPVLLLVDAQDGEEGLLRNVHRADALHALLALLLPFEELSLAGDVATVALGDDVLAQRLDGLSRDHAGADGSLDRHLEHLARD